MIDLLHEMVGPFLITIITGAFFGSMVIAISKIKPRDASDTAGASEGDQQHFHIRAVEDEFRREDF
ncbi:hypothetical protein [Rhizobium sp. RCC_161_2]|uniref:hypothetical protein n=1 Tax=Rhizobium sp. RCC_161_2 TaxID=3239219 RepID=UPI003523C8D7